MMTLEAAAKVVSKDVLDAAEAIGRRSMAAQEALWAAERAFNTAYTTEALDAVSRAKRAANDASKAASAEFAALEKALLEGLGPCEWTEICARRDAIAAARRIPFNERNRREREALAAARL